MKRAKKSQNSAFTIKIRKTIIELQKDSRILDLMGNNLSRAYIAVKKVELNALGHLALKEEVKLLLDKY